MRHIRPKALYVENNAYAAQYLRNLINKNLIAPGDVDERSIEDITPNDIIGYTQFHAFAGIGIWSYALRRAGWDDERPVWTGSCPCQPFSAAGKREGFADERHLWPAWFHLIRIGMPHTVFGEQVASKDGLGWLDIVSLNMEGAGYAFGPFDRCSAGVGAPHIRQRLYFAATLGISNTPGGGFRVVGLPTIAGDRGHPDFGQFVDGMADPEVGHRRPGSRDFGSPELGWDESSDRSLLGDLARHHQGLSPRERPPLVGTGWREEGGATEQRRGPFDILGVSGGESEQWDTRSLLGPEGPVSEWSGDGPGRPGPLGGLPNRDGAGFGEGWERCEAVGQRNSAYTDSGIGGIPDTRGSGRPDGGSREWDAGEPGGWVEGAGQTAGYDDLGILGDAASGVAQQPTRQGSGPDDQGGRQSYGRSSGPSDDDGLLGHSGRVADSDGGNAGPEWEQRGGQHRLLTQDSRVDHADRRPGPTNGFWANPDWLRCRDGKWRPVEPGTFPLAHGYPERVGILRAAGNAIDAENATDFIATFLESEADGYRDPLGDDRLLG